MATREATTSVARRGIRLWKWALWTAVMVTTAQAEHERLQVMGLCAREPAVRVDCYPPVKNFPNATEEACLAQGCCWKPLENGGVPCAFDTIGEPDHARCAKVSNASRLACRNPRFAVDAVVEDDPETCHAIGCCFDLDTGDCFQPFFEGYELLMVEETPRGWRGTLVLRRFTRGPFANDVPLLELHVIKEAASRVRVRITDPSFPRYEVPGQPTGPEDLDIVDGDASGENHSEERKSPKPEPSDYHVHFYERPFGIAVTRRKSHEVLFNSTPSAHASTSFNGLVYENQFLEISTHLEDHDAVGSPVLYGLGERWGRARLRVDRKGDHYPMFSRRPHKVTPHTRDGGDNLGGVHPFYLQVLSSGQAHGVFFQSSNAMEVVTQDAALTFRTTGGVLDFVVFTGPSTLDVTSQYTEVVGRPELPPFWALGYHLGKRGHNSVEDSMLQVVGLREAGVPLDAYWQDADYMYDHEAFTLDQRNFPLDVARSFIDDLHFNSQYYVMLMTPTIPTEPESHSREHALVINGDGLSDKSGSGSDDGMSTMNPVQSSRYFPLDRGSALDVFVKGIQGERYAEKFVGSRWSVFVDFSHPNASAYWGDMLALFHEDILPFDGVWLDADEPSSSCDMTFSGSNHSCEVKRDRGGSVGESSDEGAAPLASDVTSSGEAFIRSPDVAFPFDPYRQPFVPGQSTFARGGHGNLNAVTLPMATIQHASLHYNVHSLYGHQQAKTTRRAMDEVLQRRSISMSRASYSGDGKYGGHLSGDVDATWENLRMSISNVIQLSLLGMPFSGPSVGGNGRGMTRELSIRWNQAASFFPLFRNHAAKDADPQSPVDFDPETLNIAREAFLRRYRHLPYLYTQLYHAHAHGHAVIRALALEFPRDPIVYDVETQYLVGPALMVSPVVEEHAISTRVYFPNATWYDLESGRMIMSTVKEGTQGSDRFAQVLAPLATLQIYIRGGCIVPTQLPSTTTAMTKRGVYRLVVAMDPEVGDNAAAGDLFLDDGDSLYSVRDKRYSLVAFEARLTQNDTFELTSKRMLHGYDGPEMLVDLDEVVVFGLRGRFFANSSLHLHGSSHLEQLKADYFEQADMLVVTRMKTPIGEELNLRVEAKNSVAEDVCGDEDEAGAEHAQEDSEDDEHSQTDEPGQGAAEAHGGKPGDKDKGREEHEDENPPTVTGEQHKKKGLSKSSIIAIVAAVLFAAGFVTLLIYRRRRGYIPIT